MKYQQGIMPILMILIIVGVLAVGGGIYYFTVKKSTSSQPLVSTSQIPPGGNPSSSQNSDASVASKPSNGGDKCGDGICDAFEKAHPNACPQDCGGSSNDASSKLSSQPSQQSGQTQPPPQQTSQPTSNSQTTQGISVKSTGATYKAVSSKPTAGWFTNGQSADIALSAIDFNNTGGPLLFNHPGTVASDGTHLILADRNNNRVLIWNKLPTGNTPPDLVLGQKNFITNNPGTGLDQMNWPVSVSAGGGKLVVTDTENNRILIWNSFPTQSGQPADLVINTAGFNASPKRNINWPWGVWTNGKKLAVTSTSGSLVLLWNNFPTQNDQPADIYLTASNKFGTPRTITSDGTHLIIADHNAKVTQTSDENFFWKMWPTQDDAPYDFLMPGWKQGDFTADGKLVMFGGEIDIWNSFPQSANDKPSLSVGASGGGISSGYRFNGGDGSGIAIAGNRLYVSLSNGNKIVAFSSLPTKIDAKPDFAIGSPGIDTNTLETNFIMSNPMPATDGKSLFVSSDFDKKLYVWKNLPDESGVHPDFVYTLPAEPRDNALFENTLALAGKHTVLIWKTLPRNGEKPDFIFQNSIGNVSFQDLLGVALDDKYFYLADTAANKIYVWEGIPSQSSNPKFTITTDQPGRLSSDGKYLVVAATLSGPGGSVRIFDVGNLSSSAQPIISLGGSGVFNLPQSALISQGHLFVGDTGFNRVLIWRDIKDAITGKNADTVLGAQAIRAASEIGKNKLFHPSVPAFDGSFLWVGEFKFSERLLRFSVH